MALTRGEVIILRRPQPNGDIEVTHISKTEEGGLHPHSFTIKKERVAQYYRATREP